MSECFNEALGATVDANLVWNDRYPFDAPLLGAVYGEMVRPPALASAPVWMAVDLPPRTPVLIILGRSR